MSVKVQINTDKVGQELDKAITKALTMVGMQAENYAKLELENDPARIDTGLLRNSITWALGGESPQISSYSGDRPSKYKNNAQIPSGSYSGNAPADGDNKRTVYVGTNVDHAVYVHEGATLPSGKKIAPNHFLRNGCERNTDEFQRMMEDALSN